MAKRIGYSAAWALAFPAIHLIASMFMFAILGKLGLNNMLPSSAPKLTVGWVSFGIVAGAWAWSIWLSPVIGFALAYRGFLPGTKRTTNQKSA
jgi:hypothetical protein